MSWEVTYNNFGSEGASGFQWQGLRIDEYRTEPLLAEDGQTHYSTKHTMSGTALLVVTVDEVGQGALETAIITAQQKLTKQNRRLVIKVNGTTLADSGSNDFDDDGGLADQDDTALDPSTDEAGYPRSHIILSEIYGSSNALVSWSFEWLDIRIRTADGESAANQYDVLSHQWRQQFRIAENGLQEWRVEGTLHVKPYPGTATANSTLLGPNPDAYRRLVMPVIPPGFRVKSMDWATDKTGERLVYALAFQEHARRLPKPARRGTGTFTFSRSLMGEGGLLGTKVFEAELEGDAGASTSDLLRSLLDSSTQRIVYAGPGRDLIIQQQIREYDIYSKKRIGIKIVARGYDAAFQAQSGGAPLPQIPVNFGILSDFIGSRSQVALAPDAYGSKLIGSFKRRLFVPYGYGTGTDSFPRAELVALSGSPVEGDIDNTFPAESDATETTHEIPAEEDVPGTVEGWPVPRGDEAGMQQEDEMQAHYLQVRGVERFVYQPNLVVLSTYCEPVAQIVWPERPPTVILESEYTVTRHGEPPPPIRFATPTNGIVLEETTSLDAGAPDANDNRTYRRDYRRRVQIVAGVVGGSISWRNNRATMTFGDGSKLTITYMFPVFPAMSNRPADPRTDNPNEVMSAEIFDTVHTILHMYTLDVDIPIGRVDGD